MNGRFEFGEFVLSSSRRALYRSGREIALVPRYFDLLLLLIRRRHEAISRSEILDAVWTDVVVSDGALSQAVRTLRRALGDDPARSQYIRTVSRFGYQFVFPGVVQGEDSAPLPFASSTAAGKAPPVTNAFEAAYAELASDAPEDERRTAAETIHGLGTARAVARLREDPRGPEARALLRDARWDTPQAGAVPIFGQPRALRTLWELFSLRLRGIRRVAGSRYTSAVAGATVAGLLAGTAGGLALYLGPSSSATGAVLVLLPLIGALLGAAGASGVAAGLCCAEVLIRSRRGVALVLFAAAGGGTVGAVAHGLGSLALQGIFGQDFSPVAGGLEGLVLGAATGLGYALAAPRPGGGMAAPRGAARWLAAFAAGASCAAAAAILTATGSRLGAMSLDLLAHRFQGSQVSLEPLARLMGEASPGRATRMALGAWEGLMFASGTVLGLTHRPK